jgi:hypothetical protein
MTAIGMKNGNSQEVKHCTASSKLVSATLRATQPNSDAQQQIHDAHPATHRHHLKRIDKHHITLDNFRLSRGIQGPSTAFILQGYMLVRQHTEYSTHAVHPGATTHVHMLGASTTPQLVHGNYPSTKSICSPSILPLHYTTS